MNRKTLIIGIVIVAVLVAIGGALFILSEPTGSVIIVRLVSKNPPMENGLILPQNEKRYWDPAVIELKVGQPATIAMANNDDIETHQLAIPEFNVISKPTKPFESATLEFTPTKVGNFTFIDSRPQETYNYTDYRGVDVHQVVNHSLEQGIIVVKP
ncbi:MAG: cupredoxin domain-containing protein [Thaumarchaeota archaeon]|nr:cupredoxin domain-containing protein [Nitrososphaerota archaeon]MCL5318043.1 cupredoxin domain-containing protein [Nitrososphaerota archaeon]